MKTITRILFISLLVIGIAHADGIYKQSTTMDFDTAYKKVYTALEDNRFFIIEEINIGHNLARFKEKWDDYNLNKLDKLQVMIICNGWYANQVSNADTDMLALCPMRVTMIYQAGTTTALFARPTTFARNSKALPILTEVEDTITKAIDSALK